MNCFNHSGCAGHAGAVTRFPSVTAFVAVSFGSIHSPPAEMISGFKEIYAVHLRPFIAFAVSKT